MSSELSLLSLSCLFSRLTECVSLHWPSFRSYWEMAAPLKFNPLSHHSPHTDKREKENGRGSQAGIQGYTGRYLTTEMQTHTLIPKESLRCDSEKWGATERKILYRWKVKNKMEQITAWKPHTYTHIRYIDGYGNEWHQFSIGNGECLWGLHPISLHSPSL